MVTFSFYPLGAIPTIANTLYDQKAEISVEKIIKQDIPNGQLDEYVSFHVHLSKKKSLDHQDSLPLMGLCVKPSFPKQSIIQAKHFCNIFPYHLVFDQNFEIKQCGTMIQVLLKLKLENGTLMTNLFNLTYPRVAFTLDNLQAFINSAFLLSSIKERNGHSLVLKGIKTVIACYRCSIIIYASLIEV